METRFTVPMITSFFIMIGVFICQYYIMLYSKNPYPRTAPMPIAGNSTLANTTVGEGFTNMTAPANITAGSP